MLETFGLGGVLGLVETVGLAALEETVGLPDLVEAVGLVGLVEAVGLPALVEDVGLPALVDAFGLAGTFGLAKVPAFAGTGTLELASNFPVGAASAE